MTCKTNDTDARCGNCCSGVCNTAAIDESETSKTLTAEHLRSIFRYEPETGNFFRLKSHARFRSGELAGCKDGKGYIQISIQGRSYRGHRLAWLYMTGCWPKDEIDHINGKKDDNRWSNLRAATNQQNAKNRGRYKTNKSGFKGVSWDNRKGLWAARISSERIQRFIGYFYLKEDAMSAYCKAASELHGEFANFDDVGAI